MRRAWTGALLLLVGLGACGGSDDERGADERAADERGAENRHEARGSESRPAESADPSPAAPTEGDAEATGPGPRLRGAGFDVVPRAPVRGAVVAFAFPAPHRVLAGTDQGALLLFDVPSGHVRAYRRVARTQPVTELRLADEGPAAAAHFMDPNAGYVYGGVVWDLRRDRLWDPPSFDGARLRLSPDGAWAVQLGPEEERLEARGADGREASRPLPERAEGLGFTRDGAAFLLWAGDAIQPLVPATLRPRRPAWPLAGVPFRVAGDADRLAVREEGALVLRDALTGREVARFSDAGEDPLPAAREDGRLAWAGEGGRVWTRAPADDGDADPAPRALSPADDAPPLALRWSPAGHLVVCRGEHVDVYAGDDLGAHTRHATPCSARDAYLFEGPRPYLLDPDATTRGTLVVRTPDRRPLEVPVPDYLPLGRHGVPPRGRYVLTAGWPVQLVAVDRRRARPLLHRRGTPEKSAWSVSLAAERLSLHGRGWSARFPPGDAPRPRPPAEDEGEPPWLEYESEEESHVLVDESGERGVAVVWQDGSRYAPVAIVFADEDAEPIPLPRAFHRPVRCAFGHEGDYLDCELEATFAEDGRLTLRYGPPGDALGVFDLGRRRAVGLAEGVVRDLLLDDGTWVATLRDGRVLRLGPDLRPRATLLRPRPNRRARLAVDGTRLAIVRGASLVLVDLETNRRLHAIRLPAGGWPTFDGERISVLIPGAMLWYDFRSGELAGRVDLEGLRTLTPDRERALVCREGRLLLVPVDPDASAAARPLGPCPPAGRLELAHGFVAWTDGTRATVLRLADGQRLTLARIHLRRAPLDVAFTPEGHLWLSRPEALWALRVRAPGPLLEAALFEPTEAMLRADLVQDFLAGAPLGPPSARPAAD